MRWRIVDEPFWRVADALWVVGRQMPLQIHSRVSLTVVLDEDGTVCEGGDGPEAAIKRVEESAARAGVTLERVPEKGAGG